MLYIEPVWGRVVQTSYTAHKLNGVAFSAISSDAAFVISRAMSTKTLANETMNIYNVKSIPPLSKTMNAEKERK